MKKKKYELTCRWNEYGQVPKFILSTNSNVLLGNIYSALVLKQGHIQSVQYFCQKCKYAWISKKQEEIIECVKCLSKDCTYLPSSKHQKSFSYQNAIGLIKEAQLSIGKLKSIYYQTDNTALEISKIGITEQGYYFQFQDGECAYANTVKTVVLKASLMIPFLWDFNFPWENFNQERVSMSMISNIINGI